MDKILIWLDGKKTYISAVTLLIVPFLVGQNLISKEWGELLMGIVAILMGGGKIYTDASIKNETDLGVAIVNNRVKNNQ